MSTIPFEAVEPAQDSSTRLASVEGHPRVLVADDDPMVRQATAAVLSRAGFQVTTAADGSQAARLLRETSFDVVLSDLSMPGMDGLQLLRTVRQHDLDLPVVLMTGEPALETAVQAVEYGALRYFLKPVDLRQLIDVLIQAVRLHRIALIRREAMAGLGRPDSPPADRAGLEAAYSRALESVWIAFQPIIHWPLRQVIGYEALVRAADPQLPNPHALFSAAERLDRLFELGRIIRGKVAHEIATRDVDLDIFVNLHTRDLHDPELYSPDAPLSRCARRVVLEVTERASLEEIKDVPQKVARLRSLGFRIALDDLGSGYAGLTSFAELQPEVVKLDMSLVRDLDREPTKRRVVASFAKLCRDMGMRVVAEGIERAEERDCVVALGCDLVQGYLFARPGRPFPTVRW